MRTYSTELKKRLAVLKPLRNFDLEIRQVLLRNRNIFEDSPNISQQDVQQEFDIILQSKVYTNEKVYLVYNLLTSIVDIDLWKNNSLELSINFFFDAVEREEYSVMNYMLSLIRSIRNGEEQSIAKDGFDDLIADGRLILCLQLLNDGWVHDSFVFDNKESNFKEEYIEYLKSFRINKFVKEQNNKKIYEFLNNNWINQEWIDSKALSQIEEEWLHPILENWEKGKKIETLLKAYGRITELNIFLNNLISISKQENVQVMEEEISNLKYNLKRLNNELTTSSIINDTTMLSYSHKISSCASPYSLTSLPNTTDHNITNLQATSVDKMNTNNRINGVSQHSL